MPKTTSIALGDHFTEFLAEQVETGRYGSASEVVRAALRLMEEREARLTELRRLIQEGEDSGEAVGFDFDEWLASKKAERAA